MSKKLLAIIVALTLGPSVHAHHGFGRFDPTREIEVRGTLTGLDFVNPHSYVYFDAIGPDGERIKMQCEMRGFGGHETACRDAATCQRGTACCARRILARGERRGGVRRRGGADGAAGCPRPVGIARVRRSPTRCSARVLAPPSAPAG